MESFLPPQPAVDAAVSLIQFQPINGINYSILQLNGRGPDDSLDHNMLARPYGVAEYWPDGVPGVGDEYCAIYLKEDSDDQSYNQQVAPIRKEILGAKLSKLALQRWDKFNHTINKEPTDVGREGPAVSIVCALRQAPLSVVVLSKVVRHKKLEEGSTLGLLYFPTLLGSPKFALSALKSAQQAAIDKEQF